MGIGTNVTPEVCPFCGRPFIAVNLRDEPVTSPDTLRRLGWWRTIKTFVHSNGAEHRIALGVAFERMS